MPTSGEMVADLEIERADSHRRSTLQGKIDHIVNFITKEARRTGKPTGEIKCPTQTEWNQLATGRNPLLPSTAILMLCANDDVHDVARNRPALRQLKKYTRGSVDGCNPYHLTYFSLAQQQIL